MKCRLGSSLQAITFAGLLLPLPVVADDWQHTMFFYLVGAALEGETQVGPLTTDIDASFSDILDNLEAGFMGSYQASRSDWAYTVDVMYTGLNSSGTGTSGFGAELDVDQLIVSFDVAYRANDHLEILGGARYNSLDLGLVLAGPGGSIVQRNDSQAWIDPYVGLRTTIPFNEAWSLTLRGDVGGFDVGSELAWQLLARVDWRVAESVFVSAGYRMLDTDYEDGSGADRFGYDMTMSGPAIGIGWHF